MNHLLEVYQSLHDCGVFFFEQPLSFSSQDTAAATIECDGTYGIFVDASKLTTLAEEAVAIAHEAGHCMTGATHRLYSPFDLIEKHELRANRWAYKKLIPRDELYELMARGYTEPWDIADHFNIPEAFLRAAFDYYQTQSA